MGSKGKQNARLEQLFENEEEKLTSYPGEGEVFPLGFHPRNLLSPLMLTSPRSTKLNFNAQSEWLATLCSQDLFQRIIAYCLTMVVGLSYLTSYSMAHLLFILVHPQTTTLRSGNCPGLVLCSVVMTSYQFARRDSH